MEPRTASRMRASLIESLAEVSRFYGRGSGRRLRPRRVTLSRPSRQLSWPLLAEMDQLVLVAVKASELEHRCRYDPAGQKESNDVEAEAFDGDSGGHREERPAQPGFATDHVQDLGRPDRKRYEYRNQRDVQVVVELPDRLHLCPPVRTQHGHTVSGVDQRHSGHEEKWQQQDEPHRHAGGSCRRGHAEDAHLAGGIEPETEQNADEIHVAAVAHRAQQRAEHAGEESTGLELLLQGELVDAAPVADVSPGAVDLEQHEAVDGGNHQQEDTRHRGADEGSGGLELWQRGLDERRRKSDEDREREDHGRVSKRKEEAYSHRFLRSEERRVGKEG